MVCNGFGRSDEDVENKNRWGTVAITGRCVSEGYLLFGGELSQPICAEAMMTREEVI